MPTKVPTDLPSVVTTSKHQGSSPRSHTVDPTKHLLIEIDDDDPNSIRNNDHDVLQLISSRDDDGNESITISLRRVEDERTGLTKIERRFFDRRCLRIKQMNIGVKPDSNMNQDVRRVFSSAERRRSRPTPPTIAVVPATTNPSTVNIDPVTSQQTIKTSQRLVNNNNNKNTVRKPKSANDAYKKAESLIVARVKSAPSRHVKTSPTTSDDEGEKFDEFIDAMVNHKDSGIVRSSSPVVVVTKSQMIGESEAPSLKEAVELATADMMMMVVDGDNGNKRLHHSSFDKFDDIIGVKNEYEDEEQHVIEDLKEKVNLNAEKLASETSENSNLR